MKRLSQLNYFKYDYRKPRIKLINELAKFILFGVFFSVFFAFFEKVALGHKSFYENFGEAVYYFFTSITTIGYGDYSPQTWQGKLLFIGGICLYGVFKIVGVVELFVNVKNRKKELNSIGRLFMPFSDHIVVFFDAKTVCKFEYRFIKIFVEEALKSNKFNNSKILLVNSNDNDLFKESLKDFVEKNNSFNDFVQIINASIYEDNIFENLSIEKSKHIFVLSDIDKGMTADSVVYDTVSRVKENGFKSDSISVEVIDDKSRKRIESLGVSSIIRPTRAYPELMLRSAISKGSGDMIEELLSVNGDSCATFNLKNSSLKWPNVCYKLAEEKIGTPMAVIYKDNKVDLNPVQADVVEDVDRILVMVYDYSSYEHNELEKRINNILLD